MAFLFKSKSKHATSNALPAASRNLHTSEGVSGPSASSSSSQAATSAPNGVTASDKASPDRTTTSPPPREPNGSMNSMASTLVNAPTTQFARRERSESEAGTRPTNLMNQQIPNASLFPWSQKRLTFPSPQTNPFPRYGSAVNAAASKDGEIYMMGGLINGSMPQGDLWIIESGAGNVSCFPIATVSEGPGPRVGHASLLVGNAFIVFGGDTNVTETDTLDDTLYLLNTSSRQWARAAPNGPRPSGRYGHTLNILGSKIYVFGGQVEGYFFNDLIAFDLNGLQSPSPQWEFLIQNSSDNKHQGKPVPAARTNHTVVSHNDQLFLFGGTDGTQWFNDVWTYDPRTNAWTQQECIGYIPAQREGHAAALVGDTMYIFGGRTKECRDLGDLAAFKIPSRRWFTFQNMGPSPSPRSGHSMTTHGKNIYVIAGEPSSAPRDPVELSLIYALDTTKIRYPTDAAMPAQQTIDGRSTMSPVGRQSTEGRTSGQANRSISRDGPVANIDASRNAAPPRDAPQPNGTSQGANEPMNFSTGQVLASRLPRASVSQPSNGPPPPTQTSAPRVNGVASPPHVANNKVGPQASKPANPPQLDTVRDLPTGQMAHAPVIREVQKESSRSSREGSPSAHGRRTPTQATSKAKAMEAGEAAPLMGAGVARQRSQRSQRGHGSVDNSDDTHASRSSSTRHHHDSMDAKSLRSLADEPRSPKLTAPQDALLKELDAAKSRNAWYASELALARRAGYSATASSPTLDDRAVNQISEDDRPLIEAFMMMRSELVKMQQAMDEQSASTAKKIAEVEHQRDAAITEAAYARAKLAAHGGSQRSTPQPDASRDTDEGDRSTEISRRLAKALALQEEQSSKLENISNALANERRARQAAEEHAEAMQQKLEDLPLGRTTSEAEGLRAELHAAQTTARAEAGQRAEFEEKLRLLQLDHVSMCRKHENATTRLTEHLGSMSALEAAVAASSNRAAMFERQVEEERREREEAERKLAQARAENEERVGEIEKISRRLRDAEQLAETNAKEATTHREALMAGLARLSSQEMASKRNSMADQRLVVLQESAERANSLAKANQEAADTSAQKLRSAEERIAGLEAYQEQSSREGLQLRRQLQNSVRELTTLQNENREIKNRLEVAQRDASALAVQHGALKELLGERGINMSDARRSPAFDQSPSSRFGTPELGRLRELEQQLQSSMKMHEDTKQAYEARLQEVDNANREKLEQCENDYQSLVQYVKGTEKVLKKMREELTKYKSQNNQLQAEIGHQGGAARGESPADWAAEREAMQVSIGQIKTQMNEQISSMENDLTSLREELFQTQSRREQERVQQEKMIQAVQKTETELAQLRSENAMLETRAVDAEHKVNMLLDQVGQSVGNYRRQSQMPAGGHGEMGILGHNRMQSTSTMTDTSSHEDDVLNDPRGSLALDNLASELETLKQQWEKTSRNYRMSGQMEFERAGNKPSAGGELGDAFASWRKTLDDDEVSTSTETTLHKDSTVNKNAK